MSSPTDSTDKQNSANEALVAGADMTRYCTLCGAQIKGIGSWGHDDTCPRKPRPRSQTGGARPSTGLPPRPMPTVGPSSGPGQATADIGSVEKRVKRVVSGPRSFGADMRAAGIHVGMGRVPVCANCGEYWPCAGSAS